MRTPGWRLALATLAFLVWAPASLAALPCAALLLVRPDASLRTRLVAGALGALSVVPLAVPAADGRMPAVVGTYAILLTVAFAAGVALRPAGFVRQALRATLAAGAGTALLVQVAWGTAGWGALAWEATREAGLAMRYVVELLPGAFVVYEPLVRVVSTATPATLALKGFAGLGLAWLWCPGLGAPARTADPVAHTNRFLTEPRLPLAASRPTVT